MEDIYFVWFTGKNIHHNGSFLKLHEVVTFIKAFGNGDSSVMMEGHIYWPREEFGVKISKFSGELIKRYLGDISRVDVLRILNSTVVDSKDQSYTELIKTVEDVTGDFILGPFGSKLFGPAMDGALPKQVEIFVEQEMEDIYFVFLRGTFLDHRGSYLKLHEVQAIAKQFGNGNRTVLIEGQIHKLDEFVEIRIEKQNTRRLIEHFGTKSRPELVSLLANEMVEVTALRTRGNRGDWEENVTGEFLTGPFGRKSFGPLISGNGKRELEDNTSTIMSRLTTNKRIFVSHASKDKELTNAFLKIFLRDVVGVPIDEIFYTSHPTTGLIHGSDFRHEIKKALESAGLVILLISENFSSSQYCIAEMGGAWALGLETIPIHIPPFDQKSSGQLLGTLHYLKATDRSGLITLRTRLRKQLGIKNDTNEDVMWIEALDSFIEKVNEVSL